jgi:TRAP transporter TAXI family solute receptor
LSEAENDQIGLEPNTASSKSGLRTLVVILIVTFFAGLGAIWWTYFSQTNSLPVALRIGAGPLTNDSNTYLREVASIVNGDSERVHLDVIATRDPSENISLLNAGKIDLAVVRADTPLGGETRLIAALYPDYFQLIMNNTTVPAYDVRDIVGKRIAIPPFGTDGHRSFFAMVDHYDLPADQLSWAAVNFKEARAGVISGKYDGIFAVRSLRDPDIIRLFEDAQLKRVQLNYVPIRQAEAMSLKRPFLKVGHIPYGSFNGTGPVPTTDLPTAYVERLLVTRSDVPDSAIREVTAALFDRRLELTLRFPLAASVTVPDQNANLSVVIHNGAQLYYDREKPGIFEAYSDQIGLLLTLFAMAGSGVLALRSSLLSKQKDRADVYNYKLLELLDQARIAPGSNELLALRQEHADILRAIVVALDSDKVTDEGFQSFSLLWESVRSTLDARQRELEAMPQNVKRKPQRKTP